MAEEVRGSAANSSASSLARPALPAPSSGEGCPPAAKGRAASLDPSGPRESTPTLLAPGFWRGTRPPPLSASGLCCSSSGPTRHLPTSPSPFCKSPDDVTAEEGGLRP